MNKIANVDTAYLNLRTGPSINYTIIATLRRGTPVEIIEQQNDWSQVLVRGLEGYVATRYLAISIVADKIPVHHAAVNTGLLNFRMGPNLSHAIIDVLSRGTLVRVIEHVGEHWVRVRVGDRKGYVATQYLVLSSREEEQPTPSKPPPTKFLETTDRVRIRSGPGLQHDTIAIVDEEAVFEVQEYYVDGWVKIKYGHKDGYLVAEFTKPTERQVSLVGYFVDQPNLLMLKLQPQTLLPSLSGRTVAASVTRIWNEYGNLLQAVAELVDIPIQILVAVIGVETSGKAFDVDRRMTIRFENHIFYREWGRHNEEIFDKYFDFNRESVSQNWKNHRWRRTEDSEWLEVHTSQMREWDVLNFARRLDDGAALRSISMGLPQIMGFNYRRIGYINVQRMFLHFKRSTHAQILGLMDYVKGAGPTSDLLKTLQRSDYVSFIRGYNGSANVETYKGRMEAYMTAFQELQSEHDL